MTWSALHMLVEFASRAYRHDELGNAQRARQLRVFPRLPAPLKARLELALHHHHVLFSRQCAKALFLPCS